MGRAATYGKPVKVEIVLIRSGQTRRLTFAEAGFADQTASDAGGTPPILALGDVKVRQAGGAGDQFTDVALSDIEWLGDGVIEVTVTGTQMQSERVLVSVQDQTDPTLFDPNLVILETGTGDIICTGLVPSQPSSSDSISLGAGAQGFTPYNSMITIVDTGESNQITGWDATNPTNPVAALALDWVDETAITAGMTWEIRPFGLKVVANAQKFERTYEHIHEFIVTNVTTPTTSQCSIEGLQDTTLETAAGAYKKRSIVFANGVAAVITGFTSTGANTGTITYELDQDNSNNFASIPLDAAPAVDDQGTIY